MIGSWGGGGGMGMGGGHSGGGGVGWLRDMPDVAATLNAEITRRTLAYIKPYWQAAVLALFLTVFAAIMTTLSPVLTKTAIDSYIAKGQTVGMLVMMALTIVTLLVAFLANWTQLFVMTKVGQQMLQKMRGDLFRHLQELPLTYFDRVPSGVVVSRVINDVQVINDLLTNGILSAFSDVLTLLFTVVVMVVLSPKLAGVTFAMLPLMAVAVWVFAQKAKIAFRRTRSTVAALTGELAESISGVRVVQAFAREGASRLQFAAINDRNRLANIRANTLASGLMPVVEVCNAAATVAVIAYGGYLIVHGQSTYGTLVAFLVYVTRFFQPIRTLTQFYNQLQAATAAAEKVFELLDEPVTISE
ncbi:MAG TPA: ABC transporter ATP-binding protein, partial [Chloroflexota bacterium]